jgi:hypothetical protein
MWWHRVGLLLLCLGLFGAVGVGGVQGEGDMAAESSDAESEGPGVLQQKPSDFRVDIVETTTPVEGEDLAVTFSVENTGNPTDTQTVELTVDGLGTNATSVSLGGGETTQETLTVGTAAGDGGEYTVTVSSQDDSDNTTATVLAPSEFLVDIVETTTPIEGGTLAVTASVENVGDLIDTQTVELAVGGLGTDTTSVELDGSSSTEVTLSVATGAGDAGEYTATVASQDDTATANATVLAPDEFEVDIVGTTTPVEGAALAVTVAVENTGNSQETGTVNLTVGGLGSNATTLTLAGNESTEETLTVETGADDAGEYTATVSSESDSDNATVTVLAPAAFTVDIGLTGTPVEGEELSVVVTVTNTGDVSGTETVTLDAGDLGTNATTVTLAGGDSTSALLSVDTEPGDAGTYTATVTSETDSDSTNVTVLARPEFLVDIVGTTDPVAGEDLAVTAGVENVGDVEGTETVTLDVAGLGTNATNVTLGGGEATEVTLAVGTAAGDAGAYTATLASANDTASANVTVLAPAAFAVDIVDVDSGVAGEDIAVTAAVENVGDVSGTDTVTLTVGGLGTNATNVTLGGSETTEVTLAVGTAAGDAGEYTATVTSGTDSDSATVTVLELGAFTVDIVGVEEPVAGDPLAVTTTVENTGDTAATRPVTLAVDGLGTNATNVTLGGGETTGVTLAVGTAAGDAGAYTATVTSGNDSDSRNLSVLAPASFAVDILGANNTVEGDALDVTAEVTNTGDVAGTGTVTLAVGSLGTNATNVTLGGGNSTAVTLAVTTADGDAGAYTATVQSPDDTASTTVTVLAQAEFLVDIVGTGEPVEGEDLTVTAAVENVGDVEGTRTLDLAVGGLGNASGTVTLAGGGSTEETLSVATGAGDGGEYTATVTTGDDSDSANVTVLAPATFAVDIVGTTTPVEGEDLAVTAAVENIGDIEGTVPVTLAVGELGGNATNVTLGGGEAAEVTLSVATGAGDAGTYTATVDSQDDTASATVTVLAPASFSVEILDVSESVEGDPVEVVATVQNVGDVEDTQDVTLAVGGLGANATAVTLAGGGSVEKTLSVATDIGDAGSYTAEVATEDDSDSANLTVLGQPEFLVNITGTGQTVAGEDLAVTVTVENVGSAGGTQTLTLDVPGLDGSATTVTLDSGASVEETLSVQTGESDAGEYTVTVESDDDAATANATVLAPAEFAVEILDASDAVAGDSLAVTAAIENVGEVQGTGTVTLGVETVGSNATNVTLDSGAAAERTLTLGTDAGDAGSYTATVATGDDSASTNVTVLAPAAFSVEILALSEPVAGETIEVTTEVTNTGDIEGAETVTLDVQGLGGATTVVTLAPNESSVETLSADTATGDAGEYTATVTTADDTATANATVLAPAEFVVDGLAVTTPVAGEELAVTATVENVGEVQGTETLTLDAGPLGENSTELTLGASASTEETLTVGTAAGDAGEYEVTVTSANDSATANATVLAPAEFVVDIVAVGEPVAGESLPVTVAVENVGEVAGEQTVALAVGAVGETSRNLTLDAGVSTNETLSVSTEEGDAGAYTATVTTADDTATANVTVLAPAEFVVDIVAVGDPVEGENLSVTMSVANIGDVGGTGTVTLDVEELGGNDTAVTLDAGASAEETLSVATDPGDAGEYEVTVTTPADEDTAGATVLESATFEIVAVQTNAPVIEGDPLLVTVAVENAGDVSGNASLVVEAGPLGTNATEVGLSANATVERTLALSTGIDQTGTYTATITTGDSTNTTAVELQLPALPGHDSQPRDVLGDGLREDADGDGTFDIFDVQALFRSLDSDSVQNHAWAYDFISDGSINIFDVQGLFNRL